MIEYVISFVLILFSISDLIIKYKQLKTWQKMVEKRSKPEKNYQKSWEEWWLNHGSDD